MSHINQGIAEVPVYQLDGDQHTTTTNWYAGNQANQALQGFVFTWENEESDLLNNPIIKQHNEEKPEAKNKEEEEEEEEEEEKEEVKEKEIEKEKEKEKKLEKNPNEVEK